MQNQRLFLRVSGIMLLVVVLSSCSIPRATQAPRLSPEPPSGNRAKMDQAAGKSKSYPSRADKVREAQAI